MPTTSPAPTPTRQEKSRDAASPCRRWSGTSATNIVTTATSLTTIGTAAPTSRQSAFRISDADNGSTSSDVDISRISRSLGGSRSTGEGGKYGAHTTRPQPTATAIAAPDQQTGSTVTSTLPNSVLRVFLGSAARGVFLCKTTLTRIPALHSRRERSSREPSPPKPKWRRRRRPDHLVQPRQQRQRGGAFALGHLLRVLVRPFPLKDWLLRKCQTSATCSGWRTTGACQEGSHGFVVFRHYIPGQR